MFFLGEVGGGGGGLEFNITGRYPVFKNLHSLFKKKNCISIPCFGIIDYNSFQKTIRKQCPIVLEQIIITCLGMLD